MIWGDEKILILSLLKFSAMLFAYTSKSVNMFEQQNVSKIKFRFRTSLKPVTYKVIRNPIVGMFALSPRSLTNFSQTEA